MNATAEGRGAVETALEGFCDSLPSSVYEESSHVKVFRGNTSCKRHPGAVFRLAIEIAR